MTIPGEIPLDEVCFFDFVTHSPSSGAASDADATPTFSIYEEANDTAMLGPTNATKRTSLTGNYRGTFTASAANGFELGKFYSVVISATVGAVTAKKSETFRIGTGLDAAGVRAALGMAAADLDNQLDNLSGLSAGTGARTVTVTVTDGVTPLQNAKVRFSEGVNTYIVTTNASGVATFALDDATYTLAITKPGYTSIPAEQIVDGNETIAKTMAGLVVPTPTWSVGVLRSYDAQGVRQPSVDFTFQMNRGPGASGESFDASEFTVTSDAEGLLEVNLVRGATYEARRGSSDPVEFLVPAADDFQLPPILQHP